MSSDAVAHPRSRGENASVMRLGVGSVGSSPLTRGKPRMRHRATPDRGLIPAHAGKTLRAVQGWGLRRAHPRSRGENVGKSSRAISCRGSSPLTRGKRWEQQNP